MNLTRLRADALAGLTTSFALLPECIAFALVAHLNPLMGLYGAFIIYLRPALAATQDSQVQVIEVGGLLRELIVALVEQGDQGDQVYYEAVVGLALLELQRARRSPIRIALPVGADRRLTSACQAVMASPSLDIPFEQHAEAAGASVRTLARLFQNSLGMGFAEWRRQVQLATAVAELIQGQPVSAIARSLGYSPSSFSDMFRRELGMAPSQYPV